MLTHQDAYEPASRAPATVDDMHAMLINQTGVVGRA